MEFQRDNRNIMASKYAKISLKRRKTLVQLVLDQQVSISRAARRLSISLSTAKLIIKRYKQTGTFFESKKCKDQRIKAEGQENMPQRPQIMGEVNNAEISQQLNFECFQMDSYGIITYSYEFLPYGIPYYFFWTQQ